MVFPRQDDVGSREISAPPMCQLGSTVGKVIAVVGVPLFISQMIRLPFALFSQTRSFCLLPRKSPNPAMCQLGSTVGRKMAEVDNPWFISQITRSPVTLFSQTRSAFPSPLKSPAPTPAQSPLRFGIRMLY